MRLSSGKLGGKQYDNCVPQITVRRERSMSSVYGLHTLRKSTSDKDFFLKPANYTSYYSKSPVRTLRDLFPLQDLEKESQDGGVVKNNKSVFFFFFYQSNRKDIGILCQWLRSGLLIFRIKHYCRLLAVRQTTAFSLSRRFMCVEETDPQGCQLILAAWCRIICF